MSTAIQQFTIHPRDLQIIMDHLHHPACNYTGGIVIIRETNAQFIIRDKDEGHIATIDKEITNGSLDGKGSD
jgi:hypothetical protein